MSGFTLQCNHSESKSTYRYCAYRRKLWNFDCLNRIPTFIPISGGFWWPVTACIGSVDVYTYSINIQAV